jgi:hypothetical protein
MMRTCTIAVALAMGGGAAWAQSGNGGLEGLESCFKAARLSDAICMNLSNVPAQQADCFQKARAAQLECLQHVSSGTPSGSPSPSRPAAVAGSGDSANSPATSPGRSAANDAADDATSTVSKPSSTRSEPEPPPEKWVVSETTSPVDYSPLVTAQIQPRRSEKGGPDSLIIRCRQSHVELLLRLASPVRMASGRDVPVSYRLNDQPPVKQQWIASADGKLASYPDDAVALLRTLPDGGRMTVDVEASGPGHNAVFQLAGFDAVRRKVESACTSPSGRSRL